MQKKGAFFDSIFFNLGTYLAIVSTALCTTKMVVLSSKQNFCAKFEWSTNLICTSNCVGQNGTKIGWKFKFQDFRLEIQIFFVPLNRIQNSIQMPLSFKVKEHSLIWVPSTSQARKIALETTQKRQKKTLHPPPEQSWLLQTKACLPQITTHKRSTNTYTTYYLLM